jgi:hypothetical protein
VPWKWMKKFRLMFFQFGKKIEGFSAAKAVRVC